MQLLEIDAAGVVDADDTAMTSLDRVQHGVMLDRRAQRQTATPVERAEDRRVVGLGSSTGEDHLAGPAAEHIGDVVAGLVDRLANLPCEPVRSRWIGELLGEKGQHRLDGLGAHGRRRRMIEVGVAVVHGIQG